ncbi:hypothetical protein Y5S_03563 [Alcanivorax nanhaiticus]|uniref:Uncharacterized protein n=1 Tax=Alcanivorax nanhaiticus TaxID=1177154 RepID=A0A095SFT5_9GAMM|nr:hypothetical protein Y5S_03563 [Alcanivorax nanhaiticus]
MSYLWSRERAGGAGEERESYAHGVKIARYFANQAPWMVRKCFVSLLAGECYEQVSGSEGWGAGRSGNWRFGCYREVTEVRVSRRNRRSHWWGLWDVRVVFLWERRFRRDAP